MNHSTKRPILILLSFIMSLCTVFAKENISKNSTGINSGTNAGTKVALNCSQTTSQTDLAINNVRATIQVGGDMWWDLVNPQYEIPTGSGLNSLYAGALWIGGLDAGGQIKVAAQTYRQTGVDFWGGPINNNSVDIDPSECVKYDRHWKVSKDEVAEFRNKLGTAGYNVPNAIQTWPGNGDPTKGQDQFLAPFTDINGDGFYDWTDGDHPKYNFEAASTTGCDDYLFGDATLWWVFNDVGNIHTETNSILPLGLEIRAQAFAFRTNDEINNMTFYKYEIINRSFQSLNSTYFGQWVDPDLGNATDDFVGCDVGRGLGYCYNGDAEDETVTGYGLNPPAVGVDFFQGPLADPNDGVDNDRDGITDEVGEEIIMSKFVYYDNVNSSPIGNPNGFADYYSYLTGIWLDGQPITYGKNGRDPGAPLCDFMFPDDTDPAFAGTPWTEAIAGNRPADRRFLQSAGPFTLQPGAVNYITTGVVWARAGAGGNLASIKLIQAADDKAQSLFDNCFKLVDGPNAPDMVIRELDRKLIFTLENTNNEFVESYEEVDPTISTQFFTDNKFRFEGFQVFQLANEQVTINEQSIADPDQVRLVAQVDLKNQIGKIVNYNFDPDLGIAKPIIAVDGANKGIRHSFEITQDRFALGDPKLINHKTYYYTVVSYAYNSFKLYDPNDPSALDGQKKPYLQGRNNVQTYATIPHKPAPEVNGQILGSDYGDGMQITQLEGRGNGGRVLDFTEESRIALLASAEHMLEQPTYVAGRGPVNLKVYDPTLVPGHLHRMQFDGVSGDDVWSMSDLSVAPVLNIAADKVLGADNEQILKGSSPDYSWGISVNVKTVEPIAGGNAENNGFLEGSISYSDNTARWFGGVVDLDGNVPQNWIRSGTNASAPVDYIGFDDAEVYENVINGTWAPYKLTSKEKDGPKWSGIAEAQVKLDFLASVDLIITSDKSKWTRAAVVETSPFVTLNQKFDLRTAASVDKNGSTATGPDNNDFATGMSWFPGYAYNVETGERLNIVFGENSFLGDPDQNAQDMMWNPSSTVISSSGEAYFGGGHYIYIFNHNGDNISKDVPRYDSCNWIHQKLSTLNTTAKRDVWKDCIWTTLPVLNSGKELLSSDVHVRLRISKPYERYVNRAVQNKPGDALSPSTEYYVAEGTVVYNGVPYGRTQGTGSFDISGAPGNEFIVLVNGIAITGIIEYAGTDSITALKVAKAINAYQSIPEYAATSNLNTVTVTAAIGTGSLVNGHVISDVITTGGAATMLTNVTNISGADPITFTTDALGGTITGTGIVVSPPPANDFNPYYEFGTGDLKVTTNNLQAAKEALAEIRTVPNPYYAFSAYENNQLDNIVKITNLPPKCQIRIYTTSGTLVKEINRAVASNNSTGAVRGSESDTSVNWDLKNQNGIPIASGLYIVHVNAPGIGERVMKWFGVIRPIDLDSF